MSTAISARSIVLVLILYFGWGGVLVFVVPFLSYLKTRQMGANPFQAIFLAATSCLLISWFILLVDAYVEQRQLPALGKINDHCMLPTAMLCEPPSNSLAALMAASADQPVDHLSQRPSVTP